jgi:protein SCO1/2
MPGFGVAEPTAPNVVELDVPDAELLDQDGEPGKFVSSRIGDNIAAVTFTFTHCTTICPTLDGIFKRLQDDVADDLGEDVVMLTLSVDPVNDIPERLKQRADKLEAQEGWTFLTGEKDVVNNLLRALEVYTPNITEHPPTVFVVDGRRGVWTRLTGFPQPAKIVEVMNGYRAARSELGSNRR